MKEGNISKITLRESQTQTLAEEYQIEQSASCFVLSPSSVSNSHRDGIDNPSAAGIVHKSKQLLKALFLPIDYPSSVAEGYLEYQFYDSMQGLCSYLRGVVSTSAVLSAAGVGNAEATAMSAAMTWAVRDGLGMVGGLVFSYFSSAHFDAHVKEFRLLADILADVGMTLDMALPIILDWASSNSCPLRFSSLSPHLPSLYLVLTSFSTLCKVACGMAAGATKGNITDHFAISGNRADCQSKESTQETLVSLVGMCLGVSLANVLQKLENLSCAKGDNEDNESCAGDSALLNGQVILWGVFIVLTLVHLWANYVGMQLLRLRTLNRERAKCALQPLVEDFGRRVLENHDIFNNGSRSCQEVKAHVRRLVLTPESVSESLWGSMVGPFLPKKIHLGTGLKDLARRFKQSKTRKRSPNSWGQWSDENYMIFVDTDMRQKHAHSVSVILREGSSDRDELKAFLHAHVLEWSMHHRRANDSAAGLSKLLDESYEVTKQVFQPANAPCDGVDLYDIMGGSGWQLSRLYLGFGPSRCEWKKCD